MDSSEAALRHQPLSGIALSVSSGTTTRRDARGKHPLYGSTGRIGSTNRTEFTGPSILVARVGANAGSVYAVDGSYGVTDNTLVIRLKPGNSVSFVTELLKHAELNRLVYGSGQPLVTGTMLKQLEVPALSSEEQARIAGTLDDASAMISALEHQITKKQCIKQGIMQQLLAGRTRLSGFHGKWVSLHVASNSVLKARIGWQGLTTAEYRTSGRHRLVGGTEFVDGSIDWRAAPFVDKWRYDQDKYIQLHPGDVLLTKDGSIGKTAFVESLPGPATLNSGVFVIRPLRERYDSRFFYFMLRSRAFEQFLTRLSAGSTISHLYQRDLVGLVLDVPKSIEEQRAISQVLADVDDEIGVFRQRLVKSMATKQSMMQQLLTGRIRLPVMENIS